MLRKLLVILTLLVCCYCLENNEGLTEEARAKKKKGAVKLLKFILLLVLSKVAIFKLVSFFLFVAFFQKMFSIAGLVMKYALKNQQQMKPPETYGSPQEYNTLGYSYGSPDHEPVYQSSDSSVPSISDLGNFNWLFNKNS